MHEPPNGLTLSALRSNDPWAWQTCFDWLSPIAKKMARLRLSSYPESDIEEIASDVILRVVDRVRDSDDLTGLASWVRMLARRRAIDHSRRVTAAKRDRTVETSLEEELENNGDSSLPQVTEGSGEQEMRRELRDRLDVAMKRLKPPLDALLIGFYIEQLSYKDLAARHGLSINSVGPYLKRATIQLRSIVENDPVFESMGFLLQLPVLLLNLFLPLP